MTSQMAVFAEDFGISKAVVFGMAALPLALTIDRFTRGQFGDRKLLYVKVVF